MKSYPLTLAMPRPVAGNVLYLNAKTIKAFPIVDTKNQEIKNEIEAPLWKCFKYYPLGYDFIINIIQTVKDKGIGRYIVINDNDYFTLTLTSDDIKPYLDRFADRSVRQTASRQIYTQLHPNFILSETRKEVIKFKPFDMYEERLDKEKQKAIYKIRVSRRLFGGLIDNDIYKAHGDGYVTIPSALYPLTTYANNEDVFSSYNPMYKAYLYPLFHNTHKIRSIDEDLEDFLRAIIPENLDRNGNPEIDIVGCHNAIKAGMNIINDCASEGFFPDNFFVDRKQKRVYFYFVKKINGNTFRTWTNPKKA
jgi:hypothetical protein